MSKKQVDECCSPFDPEPWDDKELVWENRKFVKDRVTSLFHIPLNFGRVMVRNAEKIAAAEAASAEQLILSDETSLWGADVYIAVDKDVPGAEMARLSGRFLAKVFEGPYRNIRNWIRDVQSLLDAKSLELKKLYFFYTTCPRCAKVYGKNYVVILAQI